MKLEKKLDTRDIRELTNIHKMCIESCCDACIFNHKEVGCLYTRIQDVIVKETGMTNDTLTDVIIKAYEARKNR